MGKQFRGIIGHPVNGFGYKPDPSGHKYTDFHHHPAALKLGVLPPSASLLQFVPPRWNQGGTSSCTGHGTAGALTTTFASKKQPLVSPAWPRGIYTDGRAIDRTDDTQPLQDGGAAPNSVVRALAEWGVALESEEDGGRIATSPDYTTYLQDHINDEPKLGEIEDEDERPLVGINAIADGSEKLAQFCQALADGYAVMAAVDAGSDLFQNFNGQGILGYTGNDFDHWIFFGAYRTNATNTKEIQLINSWGLGLWTPDGTAWVNEDFINRGTANALVTNLGL